MFCCFLNTLGALLSKSWGTNLLADPTMFGFMVVVQLPDNVLPVEKSVQAQMPSFTDKHAETLQDILHHDFRVEVSFVLITYIIFDKTKPEEIWSKASGTI